MKYFFSLSVLIIAVSYIAFYFESKTIAFGHQGNNVYKEIDSSEASLDPGISPLGEHLNELPHLKSDPPDTSST